MRPVLIILMGIILGIIWGLYFQNITLIYLLIIFALGAFLVFSLRKTKACNKNALTGILSPYTVKILHYMAKYAKLFFKSKFIIIFIASFLISNTYFNFRNWVYEKTYTLLQNSTYVIGKVVSKRRGERIHMAIYCTVKANWFN